MPFLTAGPISLELFSSAFLRLAHLFTDVTRCVSRCVGILAQVWKQLLKREASAEKVISLKRLSKLGRQQKSAGLQIWHSGLGSEHAALGAAFEGQEL